VLLGFVGLGQRPSAFFSTLSRAKSMKATAVDGSPSSSRDTD